jgi:hypothetical protein
VARSGGDGKDGGDGSRESGLKAKVVALGRRFPPLGVALHVQERYSELRGNNIAAAVTFQAFVSLFPLLLVAVAVVGLFAPTRRPTWPGASSPRWA